MYLFKNLLWKSLRMVSLMKRFPTLGSSRAWLRNTTSSSQRRFVLKSPPALAPAPPVARSNNGFPVANSSFCRSKASEASASAFKRASSARSLLMRSSSAKSAAVSSSANRERGRVSQPSPRVVGSCVSRLASRVSHRIARRAIVRERRKHRTRTIALIIAPRIALVVAPARARVVVRVLRSRSKPSTIIARPAPQRRDRLLHVRARDRALSFRPSFLFLELSAQIPREQRVRARLRFVSRLQRHESIRVEFAVLGARSEQARAALVFLSLRRRPRRSVRGRHRVSE